MSPPKPDLRWSPLAELRAAGLADLMALHWEEIEDHQGVSPLDIDWPQYLGLERAGQLKILAAWAGRELVGYNAFFVYRPIHHRSTMWAINDGVYLDPEHRRGWLGVDLIRRAERDLASMGARVIWYTAKEQADLAGKRQRGTASKLLERLGYSSLDRSWSKTL